MGAARPRCPLPAALLGLLGCLAPGGARAEEAPPERRIAAVVVEGASRTRRDTVLTLARVREGDLLPEGGEAQVRQHLLNAGIFYDVTVESAPRGDGLELRILLREKWSLIPLPLVVVREGETIYGLTLIESNLLGRAKKLFAILRVEEGKAGGTAMYIDPHLAGSAWRLFALATATDERETTWDAEGEVGAYRRRLRAGTLALGYGFTPRTSASAGLRIGSYRHRDPEDSAEPPPDAREGVMTLRLEHDGLDLDEEVQRGSRLRLHAERGLGVLGDEIGATTLEGEARIAARAGGRRTIALLLRGFATDEPDYRSRPATDFLRGYASGRFTPDRLLGGSLEFQTPVARRRSATLSAVAFADAALLRDRFRDMTPGDARADAGLALAVYLRRVAVPVLQLYAAYAFTGGEIQPGFSLGFTF